MVLIEKFTSSLNTRRLLKMPSQTQFVCDLLPLSGTQRRRAHCLMRQPGKVASWKNLTCRTILALLSGHRKSPHSCKISWWTRLTSLTQEPRFFALWVPHWSSIGPCHEWSSSVLSVSECLALFAITTKTKAAQLRQKSLSRTSVMATIFSTSSFYRRNKPLTEESPLCFLFF